MSAQDDGYVDVATRITQFREKHPGGSLYPFDFEKPYEIVDVGGQLFVVVVAAAYRSPDDPYPGVGMAWEPFPGQSPYTEDSELQNAQTGAWGRAIVAALAADTRKSIASSEDVRNRVAAEKTSEPPKARTVTKKASPVKTADAGFERPVAGQAVAVEKTAEEALPLAAVDQILVDAGPADLEDDPGAEAVATAQLEAELVGTADSTEPPCADCNGVIGSADQVDLSGIKFRRPLCRTCFIAAKQPAK